MSSQATHLATVQATSALVTAPAAEVDPRPRENLGWRAGRPVEDPHKVKRWGFVTAKPSEYLVHVRGGKVTGRSGQGATCFKWPWDSVAVIPTSLQRIAFCADQVTAEKVGVEVVGLAVYRIADPCLAFRVLNFSFPERAQEKLEQTLTAMFVGATRRLVANLTVEECMQKRKSALAEELLREIAPVVGGMGRADDATDRGWGVVIDTIEVQEVRVLSEAVFAAMQAPYRAALEQRAQEAKALADKANAAQRAACDREIEEARIATEEAVRHRRAEAARRSAENESATALRQTELQSEQQRAELQASQAVRRAELDAEEAIRERQSEMERRQAEGQTALAIRRSELEAEAARRSAENESATALQQTELESEQRRGELRASQEVRRAELEAQQAIRERQSEMERQQAEARTALEIRQRELEAQAARAALEAHEVKAAWEQRRSELEQLLAGAETALRQLRAEAASAEGQAEALVELRKAEAAVQRAEADRRRLTAERLPDLAAALGARIAEVKVAQYGAGEHPFAQLMGGLKAILDLAEPKP